MASTIFTPKSARALLETLRPAAEEMCRLFRAMEKMKRKPVADQAVDREYFANVERIAASISRLREAGVEVKDPRRGVLDFPARRAGKRVLLCWRVGESSLRF